MEIRENIIYEGGRGGATEEEGSFGVFDGEGFGFGEGAL